MGGPIIFSVSVRAYEGGVGQCCLRQAIGRARNVLEAALTGNSGMWRKMKAALVLPARTATSAASPTPLRQGSRAQSNRRHQNEWKEFGLRHVAPSILPPLANRRGARLFQAIARIPEQRRGGLLVRQLRAT
jgi:hypothetical protein